MSTLIENSRLNKSESGAPIVVSGKIIVRGKIKTVSPVLIGSGIGDELDMELLLDSDDKPYIPGSSFTGMFSNYLIKHAKNKLSDRQRFSYSQFFGSEKTDKESQFQSHIAVEDLTIYTDYTISVRDGIKINTQTGTVLKRGKYDYEVLEPGAEFNFEAEITLRSGFNKKDFIAFLDILKSEAVPENPNLRLGAFTSYGFGKWNWKQFDVYDFDFPEDGLIWLFFQETRFDDKPKLDKPTFDFKELKAEDKIIIENSSFRLHAKFKIKNSLIIGHYGVNPNDTDKTHIKSNEIPALPGKSIKGALRSRAERILNILNPKQTKSILNSLMGFVDTEAKDSIATKSRLIVEEALIESSETEQIQHRVKIDRFTGGSRNQALFDSQPLWHKNECFDMVLSIEDPKPHEIGLMLLLLKDLWTADLPIGGEKNVGRGVLTGKEAILEIYEEGNFLKVTIEETRGGKLLINPEASVLEKYVNFLQDLKSE